MMCQTWSGHVLDVYDICPLAVDSGSKLADGVESSSGRCGLAKGIAATLYITAGGG